MRYFFAPIVASLLYIMPSDASAKVAESDTVRSTRDATHVVATPTPAAPVAASSVTRKAADDQSDQAKYAAREADSTKAQNYRGGDTLVIGTTAAVAILAVILIIVLI
jgi:hypothetical protein